MGKPTNQIPEFRRANQKKKRYRLDLANIIEGLLIVFLLNFASWLFQNMKMTGLVIAHNYFHISLLYTDAGDSFHSSHEYRRDMLLAATRGSYHHHMHEHVS